jgi:hypothetical protein
MKKFMGSVRRQKKGKGSVYRLDKVGAIPTRLETLLLAITTIRTLEAAWH